MLKMQWELTVCSSSHLHYTFCWWYKDKACKDMVNRRAGVQPRFYPSPILLHALNYSPPLSFSHIGHMCGCCLSCKYSSTLAPVGERAAQTTCWPTHTHVYACTLIHTHQSCSSLLWNGLEEYFPSEGSSAEHDSAYNNLSIQVVPMQDMHIYKD